MSERTRAALEREKMLVLRTIKELEFDRAMGKLSEKDFDEMSGRLRTRALSLMKQLDLDAAGYQRGHRRGARGARVQASRTPAPHAVRDCRRLRLRDDRTILDAVFCKKCGARLQA